MRILIALAICTVGSMLAYLSAEYVRGFALGSGASEFESHLAAYCWVLNIGVLGRQAMHAMTKWEPQ